jgi:hypothetical protein
VTVVGLGEEEEPGDDGEPEDDEASEVAVDPA